MTHERKPIWLRYQLDPNLPMKSFAFSFCCVVGATVSAVAAERPNIVFIFTDDHCEQALSAYDPSRMTTPNMDRLAKEGMLFERCYVTNAICGPSRAVIMTGQCAMRTGVLMVPNAPVGPLITLPFTPIRMPRVPPA